MGGFHATQTAQCHREKRELCVESGFVAESQEKVVAQEAEMDLMNKGRKPKAESKGLSAEGRLAPYLKVLAQTL